MADPIIPDDSISGNKVHGGVISDFQSTGIQDLSTITSLVVSNGRITVDGIRAKRLEGNVDVQGNLTVLGTITVAENTNFQKDIVIDGNITADTIRVKNLIADIKQETREPLTFVANSQQELYGKGFVFKSPELTRSLELRASGLWTNLDIDIADTSAYKISSANVLTYDTLGRSVVNSNLTSLGALKTLVVTGTSAFNDAVHVAGKLTVDGILEVQTIRADQIISANDNGTGGSNFAADTESGLNGQGLRWEANGINSLFVYRNGNKLWSNASIDLQSDQTFKIDDISVLSSTELGQTVTKSNLRQVGALRSLEVMGHTNLGYFAYFNPDDGRLGLGTETPNGALSIVENDVELIVGATNTATAIFGSYTNHDVAIVSDHIARITVKKGGEVHIGDQTFNNGVLKVFGTIEATSIVTDSRIDRSSPLEFNSVRNGSIYGLGLTWKDTSTKQLIMMSDPDRLWSSEHIEVAEGKSFYINGQAVLSQNALGGHVIESSLVKVGTLRELSVQGATTLHSDLTAKEITADSITFNNGTSSISIGHNTISISKDLSISVQGQEEIYIDNKEISIGNKQNTRRPVKVFGPLTVGVNNPDPTVSLAVSGNISFADKKFIVGPEAPVAGTFNTGDICWNTMPTADGYVGWICTVGGTPGEWLPFGAISRQ